MADLYLVLEDLGSLPRRIKIREGLTVGREPDNEVIPGDKKVGRRQFCIEIVDGRFYLRDLGSINPTIGVVGGENFPISKGALFPIFPGVVFLIGDSKVTIEGEAPGGGPAKSQPMGDQILHTSRSTAPSPKPSGESLPPEERKTAGGTPAAGSRSTSPSRGNEAKRTPIEHEEEQGTIEPPAPGKRSKSTASSNSEPSQVSQDADPFTRGSNPPTTNRSQSSPEKASPRSDEITPEQSPPGAASATPTNQEGKEAGKPTIEPPAPNIRRKASASFDADSSPPIKGEKAGTVPSEPPRRASRAAIEEKAPAQVLPSSPQLVSPAAGSPSARLVFEINNRLFVKELSPPKCSIGSSSAGDQIQIQDRSVSEHHAKIEWEGERIYLTNLSTKSNTILNDRHLRSNENVLIDGGELVLSFGSVQALLSISERLTEADLADQEEACNQILKKTNRNRRVVLDPNEKHPGIRLMLAGVVSLRAWLEQVKQNSYASGEKGNRGWFHRLKAELTVERIVILLLILVVILLSFLALGRKH